MLVSRRAGAVCAVGGVLHSLFKIASCSAQRSQALADAPRAPLRPLCSETARLLWLRTCCAVAEGANVPLSRAVPDDTSSWRCPPDLCVAAVLGDALRRMSMLGGRYGVPRSLGSVFGGYVTRFLGGSLSGAVCRVTATPGIASGANGIAVTRDGTTLLLSDTFHGSHAVHELRVVDGARLRVVRGGVDDDDADDPHSPLSPALGGASARLQYPTQLWVAPDGCVFVADGWNRRVVGLTADLRPCGSVGSGRLATPTGVCANADVVVVSELNLHRVSVFRRADGTLTRQFGAHGSGVGRLAYPRALCFTCSDRHVAVADCVNDRVSVFTVDGEFIRHVGVGVLKRPEGVACSDCDELVVADRERRCVRLFSDLGELLMTLGDGDFTGVAVHGGRVFAADSDGQRCVLWSRW
jgi:DNA-binding beta-propeller fold protein YncE